MNTRVCNPGKLQCTRRPFYPKKYLYKTWSRFMQLDGWLVFVWVLWHINLSRIINAKPTFIQIICSEKHYELSIIRVMII